ncbi:hypothetical protein FF1_039927 [Malus domestica]
MAFASATCFPSQLQLQWHPRGLAANGPVFVLPSPSYSSDCCHFRPLSLALRASRPFSAVVSAPASPRSAPTLTSPRSPTRRSGDPLCRAQPLCAR